MVSSSLKRSVTSAPSPRSCLIDVMASMSPAFSSFNVFRSLASFSIMLSYLSRALPSCLPFLDHLPPNLLTASFSISLSLEPSFRTTYTLVSPFCPCRPDRPLNCNSTLCDVCRHRAMTSIPLDLASSVSLTSTPRPPIAVAIVIMPGVPAIVFIASLLTSSRAVNIWRCSFKLKFINPDFINFC